MNSNLHSDACFFLKNIGRAITKFESKHIGSHEVIILLTSLRLESVINELVGCIGTICTDLLIQYVLMRLYARNKLK